MPKKESSKIWTLASIALLGGALFIPGIDLLAAPALISLVLSLSGGKK